MLSALRRSLGIAPHSSEPAASAGGATAASTAASTVASLGEALTMLRIRQNDCRELEGLYRRFVLPDLAPRAGRDDDLFGLIGTTVGEGLYICDALRRAFAVPGDLCEFGVAQGATSRLIARELLADPRGAARRFWLFDSFEGLPKPSAKDVLIDDIFRLGSMDAYAGTMRCPRELVESKLAEAKLPAERYRIKAGWVDRTLAEAPLPERVAFAYVDFDFYEPIKVALEWLDPRMPAGGTVVVDDYGFFSQGAQTAVDEFVGTRGGRWSLALPVEPAGKFCILAKTGDGAQR